MTGHVLDAPLYDKVECQVTGLDAIAGIAPLKTLKRLSEHEEDVVTGWQVVPTGAYLEWSDDQGTPQVACRSMAHAHDAYALNSPVAHYHPANTEAIGRGVRAMDPASRRSSLDCNRR